MDGGAPDAAGMTTQSPPQQTSSTRRRTWHFVRHYLELLVAMVVGMIALGPVMTLLWPAAHDRADVSVLVMATTMAVGMGAWMLVRGHSWAAVGEMSAAMYVPFAVLLVPYSAGAVSQSLLFTAGHVLMLPAMALAMALRPHEYAH